MANVEDCARRRMANKAHRPSLSVRHRRSYSAKRLRSRSEQDFNYARNIASYLSLAFYSTLVSFSLGKFRRARARALVLLFLFLLFLLLFLLHYHLLHLWTANSYFTDNFHNVTCYRVLSLTLLRRTVDERRTRRHKAEIEKKKKKEISAIV